MLWAGRRRWDRILSVVLILAVLGAIGIVVYMTTTPRIEERFTEFYILNPEGDAGDYPDELAPGEEGRVEVGIVNREYETAVYRLEVVAGNERVNEVGPITLAHEGKWEREVPFAFSAAGSGQKVEFLLYKGGQDEAYRSLHLWVDVRG